MAGQKIDNNHAEYELRLHPGETITEEMQLSQSPSRVAPVIGSVVLARAPEVVEVRDENPAIVNYS
jgi:hypothetical protein